MVYFLFFVLVCSSCVSLRHDTEAVFCTFVSDAYLNVAKKLFCDSYKFTTMAFWSFPPPLNEPALIYSFVHLFASDFALSLHSCSSGIGSDGMPDRNPTLVAGEPSGSGQRGL